MANLKETLAKGLVSLKQKPAPEIKDTACKPMRDPYPYGTRLELRKDQIKALGIKLGELKVGEVLDMVGKVKITAIRKNDTEDNYSEELCLQITDINLG